MENDHIAFTALTGSRFWSRHVLLSGPKPQNTNCTDMFSTVVMRHKQQTSGRLRTANNTIVKCFFQIHANGKCFISSIMSKFWWYTLHRQHKPPSSPEQRASRPIGNICTHRVWVETIFGGLPCRRSLTPCVSPSRVPILSFARYFQAPAMQAKHISMYYYLQTHFNVY